MQAVLEDSDAWQRDWGRLVRCLLTVKRLRAENEICGVKLSATTNRELDDIILHICNKLQGHFGRTCVRNLEVLYVCSSMRTHIGGHHPPHMQRATGHFGGTCVRNLEVAGLQRITYD